MLTVMGRWQCQKKSGNPTGCGYTNGIMEKIHNRESQGSIDQRLESDLK
jgi:hypothetical protein